MITPWNWPLNQICAKVAPALAAGDTMILKPSEEAPGCAAILAEILHEAGVPPGVFNLVNGDGPGVGAALILDRLIASTAIVHDLTLVTTNGDDFRDIPGLALEVWPVPAQ